ncbi:gamma-glutamyltransferase [Novosphingobium sp. MW5]|nr:gamma-glutamyltransferase [Novosphingobium sp. MW5]
MGHLKAPGDTVHLDVVDRWGNMVSATPSGGAGCKARPSCRAGHAAQFARTDVLLDDGSPSSLAPGRRPRTTLSPSLARGPDGTRVAFGTPGGDQQDQWHSAFLLRLIHHGMNLQEAIDAPLFHTEHLQASFDPRGFRAAHLLAEPAFPEATLQALRDAGHDLQVAVPVVCRPPDRRQPPPGRAVARRRDAAPDAGLCGGAGDRSYPTFLTGLTG